MKFVFRFQNVLDFKVSQEELAQQKLAECVKKINNINQTVEQINKENKNMQASILMQDPIYKGISEQVQSLKAYQKQLLQEQNQTQELLNQAREEYLEAKKERKVFEILKNKEYEKYKNLQKKKQQQVLDEYGRNTFIIHHQ